MAKFGYVRVSTSEQNTARQEILMEGLGVDKVFIETESGKTMKDRTELKAMIAYVRDGDTVVVESFGRLARNIRDLLSIVDKLTEKGVMFESQKEQIDTSTPAGRFMLTVFGALAQLEREFMLERQAEGIKAAKAAGKYNGRPRAEIDSTEFERIYKRWKDDDITAKRAYKLLGISKATWYRRLHEFETAQALKEG
jgi:DNA invertase Pin-like site-specific DNA recombinase